MSIHYILSTRVAAMFFIPSLNVSGLKAPSPEAAVVYELSLFESLRNCTFCNRAFHSLSEDSNPRCSLVSSFFFLSLWDSSPRTQRRMLRGYLSWRLLRRRLSEPWPSVTLASVSLTPSRSTLDPSRHRSASVGGSSCFKTVAKWTGSEEGARGRDIKRTSCNSALIMPKVLDPQEAIREWKNSALLFTVRCVYTQSQHLFAALSLSSVRHSLSYANSCTLQPTYK